MFDVANLESVRTALGWAVLHFLWQGAVLGLVAAGGLALVPKRNAAARYAVGCGALAVGLVTFGATFVLSIPPAGLATGPLVALPPSVDVAAPEFVAAASILTELTATPTSNPAAPLAWFWTAGALLMVLRLSRGGVWAHRLRTRSISPVEAQWQRVVDALREDLGIRRAVRLMRSELVDSPAVVGWLTPLVLVPATTFTALTPDQLRSVLAHELAHIRRHDPLVNALQAVVEITLFFHPVVWWLSRLVREEREHCCDAVAVHATGSSLLLAQALTRLESLRLTSPSVALAAKTHEGPLMTRITRILDVRKSPAPRPVGWRVLSLLGAGALALGLGVAQAAAAPSTAASNTARLSLQGRDAKTDYAIVEARILQAVEAGNLSAVDAKRTLGALRRTMLDGVSWRERAVDVTRRSDPRQGSVRAPLDRTTDRPGERRVDFTTRRTDLATEPRPVRGGQSSRQPRSDQPRSGQPRSDQPRSGQPRSDDPRRLQYLRDYEKTVQDLKTAVDARKLTQVEAAKRIAELRSELNKLTVERDRLQSEKADRRAQYDTLQEDLRRAAARGHISNDEAKEALDRAKKRLSREEPRDLLLSPPRAVREPAPVDTSVESIRWRASDLEAERRDLENAHKRLESYRSDLEAQRRADELADRDAAIRSLEADRRALIEQQRAIEKDVRARKKNQQERKARVEWLDRIEQLEIDVERKPTAKDEPKKGARRKQPKAGEEGSWELLDVPAKDYGEKKKAYEKKKDDVEMKAKRRTAVDAIAPKRDSIR